MKSILPALSILLSVGICDAQFKTGTKNMCPTVFVNDMDELIQNSSAIGFNIFPTDFIPSNHHPIPEFKNLECLYFEFSYSPDSSEAGKKRFIVQLKNRLDYFGFLFKSKELKSVYFHISEQIFMSDSEVRRAGSSWKKNADINLRNAWMAFGNELRVKYPHLKLYAENWNW
jgi:hypothetical protein